MRNLSKCDGISKRSKMPCQAIAMKNGKCRSHGGKSTGPKDRVAKSEQMKGNKNNTPTTGEFEYIGYETLTDEEKLLIVGMNKQVMALLDQEIALITIRQRRMMIRIKGLMNAGDLTVTQIEEERGYSDRKFKRSNIVKETKQGTLGQIQAIEESLTRLQGKITKMIEIKYNIEREVGSLNDTSGIEKFMVALNSAAKNVWSGEQTTTIESEDNEE